jgi:class 3 adenylate cyclase
VRPVCGDVPRPDRGARPLQHARGVCSLLTAEELQERLDALASDWPNSIALELPAPTLARDEDYRRRWLTFIRQAASPGAALALYRMNSMIDVRDVLPAIRVPTLVAYRRNARFGHGAGAWRASGDDLMTPASEANFLGAQIPGAKLLALDGIDHLPWAGDAEELAGEVEEFLTGVRRGPEPDRVLATIMFTDIVGSTEIAARLGDSGWRDLLERHHALVRRQLDRFRGDEIDTAGDGFIASFDGPARAIRCAKAIADSVTALDLEVKAAIHTGECEIADGKPAGIAVHLAARIAALAEPGEVLVSSTVKDLVAGSRIEFADRGTRALKGIPGEWRVFALREVSE